MSEDGLWASVGVLFRAHPWHGVSIGDKAPDVVTTYIEIVPTDTVKYEMDKRTGILRVDRPQKYSNVCPTLYGFLPRTLCGDLVGQFSGERAGTAGVVGDGDPMDICVLAERPITHGDILLQAIPIGGLRLLDGNEADDKIIAVMRGDAVYGDWKDVSECPAAVVDRLRHYFLTYKQGPDRGPDEVSIQAVYGREEAHEVIRRSQEDYRAQFPLVIADIPRTLRA